MIGVNPKSGKPQWRHPWQTDYACNIAVPLAIAGRVLISCGENHGTALLEITADGTVTEQYTSTGVDSVLRSEWQTPLLVDGRLYGFDNVGSAGPVTHFTCIDPLTAKQQWQQKRFGKGNAIAADGKLWCTTMDGELVLLRATPDAFTELARAQVLETTRKPPPSPTGGCTCGMGWRLSASTCVSDDLTAGQLSPCHYAGAGWPEKYVGSLPGFHLMLQPMLGFWSGDRICRRARRRRRRAGPRRSPGCRSRAGCRRTGRGRRAVVRWSNRKKSGVQAAR